MRSSNINIINALLAIDIIIITICMFFGNRDWLYTSQIGFFSSALIISASMMSYRKMVERGIELNDGVAIDDDRDELDKIDDPHNLYDEDKSLEEVVKEEREELKSRKRSVREVIKDSKASFSGFRVGAYAVLILGFFYLDRHNYLHIPSYLISLSIPPLVVIFTLLRER